MGVPTLSVQANGIGAVADDNLNTYCQTGAVVSDLRAFVGLSRMTVWLVGTDTPSDGGQGMFYWSSTATAADDDGVTTIAPFGLSTGRWLRQSGATSDFLNLVLFGGDPTGADFSDAAFAAFTTSVLTTGIPGYIPPGNYKFASQATIDWALTSGSRTGAKFFGVEGRSVLDFTAVGTAPALLFTCAAVSDSCFYEVFKDISVNGNVAGAVVAIGTTDDTKAFNGCEFKIQIANANTSTSAIGLQVNGCFNSNIWVTANNTTHGDAIQVRYMAFCSMWGAGGHCDNALHLTSFFVFGNVFQTMDYEVCNTCVVIDSASAQRNTWMGGQFVFTNGSGPPVAAINATAGAQNKFFNSNFAAGTLAASGTGVIIYGPTPLGIEIFAGVAIKPSSGDGDLVLQAPASGNAASIVMDTVDSTRWVAGKNNAAETGGNVGSDYIISRFDDTGASIDNPLTITRSTGVTNILRAALAAGGGTLSFYGASLQTKPTVTGAKGGNAALTSLLTILATLGLLTDSTT